MRIYVKLVSTEQVSLPDNVRSYFISFLKKLFEEYDKSLYYFLFNSKRTKPYVFSPYFGRNFKERRVSKQMSFTFQVEIFL